MDEVENIIKEALPRLSSDSLEMMKDTLSNLGVSDPLDLKLVKEEDLAHVLKPIQIRQFIAVLYFR